MNVLRELRRIENRSLISKIRAIILLCILLITSTCAWFLSQKNVTVDELVGEANAWDVIYKYNEEILNEEITFNVSDFYPGKSYSKVIEIYNMGEYPASIEMSIKSISYMGTNIKDSLSANDGIKEYADGRIVKVFDTDDYPFEIIYTLNRKYLYEKYSEDFEKLSVENQNAYATLTITLNWDYDKVNSSTDSNTIVGDTVDTGIGNTLFYYYNSIKNEANYEELCSKAVELKLDLTSKNIEKDAVDKNENLINGVGMEYMNTTNET